MKKYLFFLFAVIGLCSTGFGQVKDFTVNLLDGREFNLYSHLNKGEYVVMTFLFDG